VERDGRDLGKEEEGERRAEGADEGEGAAEVGRPQGEHEEAHRGQDRDEARELAETTFHPLDRRRARPRRSLVAGHAERERGGGPRYRRLRAAFLPLDWPLAFAFDRLAFFAGDALGRARGRGMAAIAASPAFCISSGVRSCLCVATLQTWPKGS